MDRMDYNSASRFVAKNNLDVNIPLRTLGVAILECQQNKKPLVIYLHNEYEPFSGEFVCHINQDVIEKSNFIVWDLIGAQSLEGLVEICSLHLNCDLLESYISTFKPAVFVFNLFNEAPELTAFYDGDTSCDLIIGRIFEEDNAQSISIMPTEELETTGVPDEEMDTTRVLEEKIMEIDLRNKTLKEVLNEAGLELTKSLTEAWENSIATIRPLLIYIHNSQDIFSKSMWPLLTNKDVNSLFGEYTFYAWDMNDASENFTFYEMVLKHRGLSEIERHMKRRMSCLFTFSSVNGQMEMSGFFDGSVKREEFLFELYNIQMVHREKKHAKFTLIQKKAIVSAVEKITYVFQDLPLTYDTIEETIQKTVLLEPEYLQKLMVIFYYNENDSFCKKFMRLLASSSKLRTVLSDLFVIVPLDVKDCSYGMALKSTVKNNFNIDLMEKCIDEKQGALFVVVSVGSRPELIRSYTGDCSFIDMKEGFLQLSYAFQEQRTITDIVERNVCDKFIQMHSSLPSYYRNKTSLHEAIQEHCLCSPVKKRKMLLLYYSDVTNPRCTNFVEKTLKQPEVQTSIRANYYFVAWEMRVSNEERENLCLAMGRCFALEKMEMMFKEGIPGVYLFMPIGHTLVLFDYMDGRKQFGKSDVMKKLKMGEEFLKAEILSETQLQNCDNGDGPIQFQQLMYDQLGDRDYDCFELKLSGMADLLKRKLSFGMYGPPAEEENKMDVKVRKKQNEKIQNLYNKILEQVKKFAESNDLVVMTCIFNCLIPLPKTKINRLTKVPNYNPSLDFTPVPVFVLRKCVNCPEGKRPCRVYIDHDMRIYQNWYSYLENNKLPKGIFIVPKDGKYQGDNFGRVRVQYRLSPACAIGNEILKVVDISSTAAGIAAGAIGLATLIPAITVAPVVAVGAAVTGIGVGIYSLVRSSITLHDRFCHDESMSLANSQARGAYLNLVAGSFSFTGLGATLMLSYFVKNGATVGLFVKSTVTGLTSMNVVTNGVAVANSAFDVLYNYITDDETPTALTLLQLSSSILFFGHAVYNFKTADNIINEAQYESLLEIDASLRSNRHRKTFNKLMEDTIHDNGNVQKRQAEVISYMKELNNSDEVLTTLTRTNKEMNKSGIRYSVKDGQINFNGKLVDIGEFSNMSKMQRSEYMMNLPPKQDSKPIQYQKVQDIVSNQFSLDAPNITSVMVSGFQLAMKLSDLSDLTNYFSFYVQEQIYTMLKMLLDMIFGDVNLKDNLLNLYPPAKIVVAILEMILKYFKGLVMEQERKCAKEGVDNEEIRKDIPRVIFWMEKAVIRSRLSMETTLKEMINFTYKWMCKEIYERARDLCHRQDAVDGTKSSVICSVCNGVYYT